MSWNNFELDSFVLIGDVKICVNDFLLQKKNKNKNETQKLVKWVIG